MVHRFAEAVAERAYLDNNATAPLLPEVVEAMRPWFGSRFGNASSGHARGRQARDAVEAARGSVASLIGATPEEIVFTSGGSEGDTTALLGMVTAGDHVITSAIEHHAVLESCRHLEHAGVAVTEVGVDRQGRVDPGAVREALRPSTRLISVMMANNETGVLQPLEAIGALASEADVWFHTDAVQAVGKVRVDVRRLRCDLLTLSGHKLHGPPGVGALYVRHGAFPRSLVLGGPQEHGLRAGTENVPAIVGLGAAARHAVAWLAGGGDVGMRALRDHLEREVLAAIDGVSVNGGGAERVPNTTSLGFPGIAGKSLAVALDLEGIAVSTGSACAAGSSDPPYVLTAMGQSSAQAYAAIRVSLGKLTTPAEVEYLLEYLPTTVARLRALSPAFAARRRAES